MRMFDYAENQAHNHRMNSGDKQYVWQLNQWPHWTFDHDQLSITLSKVHRAQGHLLGRMENLGFEMRDQAALTIFTEDVLKTSEIEGEKLDPHAVRSSIARRLGLDIGALAPADRHVDGVVEMVLDATRNFKQPLTTSKLFGWHAALFPTGYSGMSRIQVAQWRNDETGPMQVVSGAVGRQTVHFEAPPANLLEDEIKEFLNWFNKNQSVDPLLKAGLAHLWFVTLHPFDDGNGRIARAIGDMGLAKADGTGQRFYSLSAQVQRERKHYYDILEQSQKGNLDATVWLEWFLACMLRAIELATDTLSDVVSKASFWQRWATTPLNERQIKMINRLLDGFEGNMTSSKWAIIAKCSADTALRDINQLIALGIMEKPEQGGRSTNYVLKVT